MQQFAATPLAQHARRCRRASPELDNPAFLGPTARPAKSRYAADIPGSVLSSSGAVVVVPSGVLVVELAGLEAAVEDADPPVAELTERGLVADLPVP